MRPLETRAARATARYPVNAPNGDSMSYDVRAVLVDNEGCLVHGKGLRFRNLRIDLLRRWIHAHPCVHFGLATGRSVPYVEAMTQVLGLTNRASGKPSDGRVETPSICETGSVLYWPWSDRYEVLGELPATRGLISHLRDVPYRVELGKVACLSLYPEDGLSVPKLLELVIAFDGIDQFEVSSSAAAVDITPSGVDKGTAVELVRTRLGLERQHVLCIGDSGNDLSMRRVAGWFACPANATDLCAQEADYRSPYPATKGVIDILDHFLG